MKKQEVRKRCKSETGSITLFVLIVMLFFLIMIISLYTKTKNSKSAQLTNIERIEQQYTVTDEEMQKLYNYLEKHL